MISFALVRLLKIWDQSPHNAFTDLVLFGGRLLCAFREGQTHMTRDGSLRILASADGACWETLATFVQPGYDLRDPHLVVHPDGRLMLVAGRVSAADHRSLMSVVGFSADGATWSPLEAVGEGGNWIWRLAWAGGRGLALGYSPWEQPPFVRLYQTADGLDYQVRVPSLVDEDYPNESGLLIDGNGTAQCLLRRDGGSGTALWGAARPPYRDWQWHDTGQVLGCPQLVLGPGGQVVGAVRFFDAQGRARTGLIALDDDGNVGLAGVLPSGGDCAYPGLVWDGEEGLLRVSYYSSHEGKASIYYAELVAGSD